MKTNLFTSVLITMLFANVTFGQDVTTVTATNYDISDNLDLKAVASIFGESKDLADFEYRINNPKTQISNLDLNRDGQVDYLRVIESIEGNTHLIVLQSVLGKDLYQDVATIEVEKDTRNNTVQVQVVGDVFLYGNNYIYEPVYYVRPIIFTTFWHRGYIAYYSPWYWGYYPTYYSYWAPYPIFRYRNNVYNYVNVHNHYYYTDTRRSTRAVAMHNRTRSNYYERQNPNQSFTRRNEGVANSYVMNQTRSNTVGNSTRNNASTANNSTRGNSANTANSTRNSSTLNSSTGSGRSSSIETRNSNTRSSSSGISSSPIRNNSVENTSSSTRNSSISNSSSTRSNSSSSSSRSSSLGNSSSPTRSGSIETGSSNSGSRSSANTGNSSSRSSSSSSGRTTR